MSDHFPLFWPSRTKPGSKYMNDHMKTFGWVNLLKEIAKTKVFDMDGMNSIESVRMSPAFDVLVFASEEKMFNEAQNLEMEQIMRKT